MSFPSIPSYSSVLVLLANFHGSYAPGLASLSVQRARARPYVVITSIPAVRQSEPLRAWYKYSRSGKTARVLQLALETCRAILVPCILRRSSETRWDRQSNINVNVIAIYPESNPVRNPGRVLTSCQEQVEFGLAACAAKTSRVGCALIIS